MPKFQDLATWRQADQLMQPALIRLIHNLQKQLEQSDWKGNYEEVPVWTGEVSEDTKTQVMALRSQLAQATPPEAAQIEQTLADLPTPHPGYLLHLTQGDRHQAVDLWEICYEICFRDYDAVTGTSRSRGFGQPGSQRVEVDTTLLDEAGEVDWDTLDDKTKRIVDRIFAGLGK